MTLRLNCLAVLFSSIWLTHSDVFLKSKQKLALELDNLGAEGKGNLRTILCNAPHVTGQGTGMQKVQVIFWDPYNFIC